MTLYWTLKQSDLWFTSLNWQNFTSFCQGFRQDLPGKNKKDSPFLSWGISASQGARSLPINGMRHVALPPRVSNYVLLPAPWSVSWHSRNWQSQLYLWELQVAFQIPVLCKLKLGCLIEPSCWGICSFLTLYSYAFAYQVCNSILTGSIPLNNQLSCSSERNFIVQALSPIIAPEFWFHWTKLQGSSWWNWCL